MERPLPPVNLTEVTLGVLLSHPNETIERNAISILRMLQKIQAGDPKADCIHLHDHDNSPTACFTGYPER